MKNYINLLFIFLFCITLYINCGDEEDGENPLGYKLYVTLQASDKIAVVDSDDLRLLSEVDVESAMDDIMDMSQMPHDVIVDDLNSFWFISSMMSGFISMYNLNTDEMISSLVVGDQPALLALDEENKKLYISRMMPTEEDNESSVIHELSYENDILESSNIFDLQFDAPHALAYDQISGSVFTASNTNDYLAKIDPLTGGVDYQTLDPFFNNNPNLPVNRLKPIQIALKDSFLFITCSGGESYRYIDTDNDGYYEWVTEIVEGRVQMRKTGDLSMLGTFLFDDFSTPWHIVASPQDGDNRIFVALAGDALQEHSGVSCLEFGEEMNDGETVYYLSELWRTTDSSYGTMHGIDINHDGKTIYVSGRSDGRIYMFDSTTGESLGSKELDNSCGICTGGISISDYKSNLSYP